MKTYREHLIASRAKALKIIADGLDHPDPTTRFANAVQFITWQQTSIDFDDPMPAEPDALDAEEITDHKENK